MASITWLHQFEGLAPTVGSGNISLGTYASITSGGKFGNRLYSGTLNSTSTSSTGAVLSGDIWTWEFWINYGGTNRVTGWPNQILFEVSSLTRVYLYTSTGVKFLDYGSTGWFNPNTWINIVISRRDNELALWTNGTRRIYRNDITGTQSTAGTLRYHTVSLQSLDSMRVTDGQSNFLLTDTSISVPTAAYNNVLPDDPYFEPPAPEPETPLLCWQLTGQHLNGRNFSLNGPNKFPGIESLRLPELKNIRVIEDGRQII